MQTLLKKLRKIHPGNILAVLFLFFITLVGSSCLPEVIYEAGNCLYWETGIPEFIRRIDAYCDEPLTFDQTQNPLLNNGTYINLNGLIAKILQQPELNERVMLKNGHLSHVISDSADPEDIRKAADNIIRFHNAHTHSGGKFLFVMVSSQISKYEDLLPDGYTDTTNETADNFLALLEEAGVPYLDLREEMYKEGISVTDAYYTTDHHWKPQTGFWAYRKILDKLTQMKAIDSVDPFYTDPENFTFETYENTFLGSSGKRTGIYYAGLDDSILIRPNFETDIAITIPERELELQGRYEDVCYNTEAVHNYENPNFYLENSYGLYGWGDTQITHWRNEKAPQQGKFLLIGESFGNIPFSLMSICFSSCDELDMRHYEEEFAAYYEEYAPDTVIVEVNVDMTISQFTSFSYLD